MLQELSVRDLGVIADLSLVLRSGMTAVTGETGAGKTLLVEAIDLLVGGRADAILVRPGAAEAWVEGRFSRGDDEVILARAIPAGGGRSRAYAGGRMATVGHLAETGADLIDLHGQHAHQSLLKQSVQRAALDSFGAVDVDALRAAKDELRDLRVRLEGLGGDARARAREIDLLRFQLAEIDAATLSDPDEERALEEQEERLADATAHREAAWLAYDALRADGGAIDAVGRAIAAVTGRAPLGELESRLRSLTADLGDSADDARALGESIADDPARLEEVRARRSQLRDLCKKYGDTVPDVVAFAEEARARLDELESFEARAASLESLIGAATQRARDMAGEIGRQRRAAAPKLARAIEANLRTLAMSKARFDVTIGGADPGDEVTFLLAANPGEPAQPLSRVASGGELARAMLAARLVLTMGPPTLVFDEVDAGVGGEAALAVGRALAALGRDRQVLVVTHLPQVAAFADHQVMVEKSARGARTIATARVVEGPDRVVELSRMLSGQPDSEAARGHAAELLQAAARERGR